MDVPITIMGAILPFYAFLDMVETALNVWSDLSVTAIVDKELRQSNSILDEAALNL
jgi:Na+/H+-dicarboxylate symporter